LALVEPLVVMVLGVTLGLVDQQATHTSGWLRVPALVASLILVAQAILTVEQRRHTVDRHAREEFVSESTEVVTVQQITTVSNPGMAVHGGMPSAKETVTTTTKAREGPQVMFFVMGLAVWLGLATLANPGAPRNLLLLSLLASFLLFAEAYKQMRGRS